MTRYIELLKKQRETLKARAVSAYHMDQFINKYRHKMKYTPHYSHLPAANAVYALDKIIYNESKHFGELRFKVIGN